MCCVRLQLILAPVPGDGIERRSAIRDNQHVKVRSDGLVLVNSVTNRDCEASEVVEQEENPVAPGLERVQSVMEDGKCFNLQQEFELRPGDDVRVLWDDFKTDCVNQVGPKGHDVAVRVESLCVGVQGDGGRVVLSKCVNQGVFQTRLVGNLVLEASSRSGRVVERSVTEGVVEN